MDINSSIIGALLASALGLLVFFLKSFFSKTEKDNSKQDEEIKTVESKLTDDIHYMQLCYKDIKHSIELIRVDFNHTKKDIKQIEETIKSVPSLVAQNDRKWDRIDENREKIETVSNELLQLKSTLATM